MKGLQVAALLVFCISFTEALRCNCVYMIGSEDYYNTKQNCHKDDDVCVSASGLIPAFGNDIFIYKMCMGSARAEGLKNLKWLQVNICRTDFCN